MLQEFYLAALDAACDRARQGTTDVTTHDDTEVEIKIDNKGRVRIILRNQQDDEAHDLWAEAGRERSATSTVAHLMTTDDYLCITFTPQRVQRTA